MYINQGSFLKNFLTNNELKVILELIEKLTKGELELNCDITKLTEN